MSSPDDKSYIDELNKSLYSRDVPDVQTRRKMRSFDDKTNVKTDWEHPQEKPLEPVELNTKYKNHSMSFFTKLFIFSLVFCLLAISIGAYLFWNGANFISGDNIDISISGPVSIPGGQPVSFDVAIKNKNNVGLELVDMTVDFPSGTTDPNNPSQVLKTYQKLVGNIPAGGSANESVKATIFGEENLQKQIMVTLTYNVSGSTSVFKKTKTYDVLINSSPLNLKVSSFKEVTSGQEFDIKVELISNSQDTLKNIMLKATYPFGYNFKSSTLAPFADKNVWNFGDLPAGAKRTFTIRGTLAGENSDLRVFHFDVGSQSSKDTNSIGTLYMSIQQDVNIQKPFIALDLEIGGEKGTGNSVQNFDRTSSVDIKWSNNLPTIVSNMKIEAKLDGTAYDNTTVVPNDGYFDSKNNTIIWNQQTNSELASVGSGDSGEVSFTVIPRNKSTTSNKITNPFISISASASGNRTQETNVPSVVTSSVNRNIVIPSDISLSGRIVRTVGPFSNSGPIPPKVDQNTSYTVIWSIDNTSSLVNDIEVKATLPPYVKWLDTVSPEDSNISYDQNSGLVTWSVGSVNANTSGTSLRREVSFQISFTPSTNQVGNAPTLVNQAVLSGTDNFTKTEAKSVQGALTTRFSTDPAYKTGNEAVIK